MIYYKSELRATAPFDVRKFILRTGFFYAKSKRSIFQLVERPSLIYDYCDLKTPNRGRGRWAWLTLRGSHKRNAWWIMNVRNGGDTLCSASRWRNGHFLCRGSFLRENNQDEYSLAMLVSLFLCLRADINYNDYATKSSQTDSFSKILPTWRLPRDWMSTKFSNMVSK